MTNQNGFLSLVILLLVAASIAATVYFLALEQASLQSIVNQTMPETKSTFALEVYDSLEQCRKITEKPCVFRTCDDTLPLKTAGQSCGPDFKIGWVSNDWYKQTISGQQTPVIKLIANKKTIAGERGSGCWPYQDHTGVNMMKLCWDAYTTPNKAVKVERGQEVTVEIETDQQPTKVSATIFEFATKRVVKPISLHRSLFNQLIIDVEQGNYLLNVHAQWPYGDISYGFKLEVSASFSP